MCINDCVQYDASVYSLMKCYGLLVHGESRMRVELQCSKQHWWRQTYTHFMPLNSTYEMLPGRFDFPPLLLQLFLCPFIQLVKTVSPCDISGYIRDCFWCLSEVIKAAIFERKYFLFLIRWTPVSPSNLQSSSSVFRDRIFDKQKFIYVEIHSRFEPLILCLVVQHLMH